MAMEVIIRASKWVGRGEGLQDGTRLPPIQAYMDDMTTLTKTARSARRLYWHSTGKWGKAWEWRLLSDVGRRLQVPRCTVVTAMRSDMVLCSECERIVYFNELTIPFEDAIEEPFERKKFKYAELVTEAREQGWQAHTRPVEIVARGSVAKPTIWLLLDFGFQDGHSKEF